MGLDMYLTAKRYLSEYDEKDKPVLKKLDEIFPGKKVNRIEGNACYWRKANHIHQWFVKNVQNGKDECLQHYVSREQLLDLIETCEAVEEQPEKASELLPPQTGFFFGRTEIDEYYMNDLDDTVKQITQALNRYPSEEGWSFEYCSSW